MTTQELTGIVHELTFWKGFVQTKRFINGWVRNEKTPELNQFVHDFIKSKLTTESKVIDVGSGVVSILRGTVPAHQLTAVDPLGGLYGFVFDYKRAKIDPPVAVPCEELGEHFKGADIVHMSNALDHTQNPEQAFKALLLATKKDGYIIIQGFENEAVFENWQGFHQHNLTLEGDDIICTKNGGTFTVLAGPPFEVVHAEKFNVEKKTWFIWIAKRS